MQFLNENTQDPQFSEETRLYYVNKFASQLLKKHLLPDMIFQMFLGLNQNQVSSIQLQYQNQDSQKVTFYQEFASFFANSSFKQKHYLITNYMSELQAKFQQNSQMIGIQIYFQFLVSIFLRKVDNKHQVSMNLLFNQQFNQLFQQITSKLLRINYNLCFSLCYLFSKNLQIAMAISYQPNYCTSCKKLLNFHNDIDDQIFREAFITLTLSEDLDLQNSSNIIYSPNQPLMFHHLLNLYLQILYSQYKGLAQSPQLMNTLLKKELKHFRINELIMSDWIQKGKQKYVLNFMRIFGQDFISFNELNLVKCLNFKLKQQPQNQVQTHSSGTKQTILTLLNDFSNGIQLENFNLMIKLWGFVEDKNSHQITKKFFQILDDCQDLNQVMISCINFIENIEFKIDDKSSSTQANSGKNYII